jgi:uncharacterized protein (TIGR02452 family)
MSETTAKRPEGATVNRLDVWKDTVDKCSGPNGKVSKIEVVTSIKFHTVTVDMQKLYDITPVHVLNMDTADAAMDLVRKGYRPLLLNMSDNKTAGGMVRSGSPAQEENLFRRSNYFKTLLQEYYPLSETDVVFSPQVCFFKDNEECRYKDLEKGVFVDCIACPAINCPAIKQSENGEGGYVFKESADRVLMKEKARMIFKVAYLYGHDVLVLSAHGCGAWAGPAHEIAQIYQELIKEYEGCFRAIIFAILADGPVSGSLNNFEIFKNTLLPPQDEVHNL